MAYVSFRLRRKDLIASPDANPFGSYVRGSATDTPEGFTRVDSDSALRSDDFVFATEDLDVDITFSAVATTYTTVKLEWSPITLTNPVDIGASESGVQGIVIVYSETGAPETVADGAIIKRQSFNDLVYSVEHTNLAPGKWAYYSMFLHWNQNGTGPSGTDWYERVATLQELVPFDHGSSDLLWSRIPGYYRVADTSGRELDPRGLGRGQLQRFLSVFGFELDKTRTLIDAVMTQYDPTITESESINNLAKMLGLEVSVDDVGTSRIRQLLLDLAFLRKRKGTIEATKQYITAVSGSRVDVIESPYSPKYTFLVYAQKTNLVADSLFVIETGTKKWDLSTENASVTYTKDGGELTVTNYNSSSAQFALTSLVEVPVEADINYWSSIVMEGSGSVYGSYWSASAGWDNWTTEEQYDQVMPPNLSPDGRSVILMPGQSASTMAYPVMIFGLGASATTTVSEWMVEPQVYGNFFNGDSDFGGFVYQDNFADYRWDGSEYASYSTYSANRKKTQETIDRLLPSLIPVTMELDPQIGYQIFYNWIPGKVLE